VERQPIISRLRLHSIKTIETMSDDMIDSTTASPHAMSKKPQRPGFFLSNNTDYDWRDYAYTESCHSPIAGTVIHSKKHEQMMIEWQAPIQFPAQLVCCNPDNSQLTITINEAFHLDNTHSAQSTPFSLLIHPWKKGVQKNAILYHEAVVK